MRGVYLNAWATGSSRRIAEAIELARTTEVNTLILDMKDATGFVSYASGVPAIRESGALGEIRIRDLPALLRRLESEGVYPVARIVIVKDPVLIAHRPELAVQDTAGGVWMDSKELIWLDLYNREVWEYHVALAEELARLGFPEIQWDYVRFPDAPAADMERAVFRRDSLGAKAEAVRAFLGYARDRLDAVGHDVAMTADVFGVTTTANRDVGIGQLWERFIDRVDAALPMVYPSHYWQGSYGFQTPNAHPYEVVREALEDSRTSPWASPATERRRCGRRSRRPTTPGSASGSSGIPGAGTPGTRCSPPRAFTSSPWSGWAGRSCPRASASRPWSGTPVPGPWRIRSGR